MKSLPVIAAALVILAGSPSIAQPTQAPSTAPPTTVAPGASGTITSRDAAAASGDSNQAVATTDASAMTPAKGANSFTMDQARGRLEEKGFSGVSDLVKDEDGIWRGKAQKGGSATAVWLDYKGNIGEGR